MINSKINISDFTYDLPDERIAKYPLPERDQSRLLHWQKGKIADHTFQDLPDLLNGDEILFFNNTKVIPARLHFKKPSGGQIEIFLLNPIFPASVEQAMRCENQTIWHCAIGNLKRWNEGLFLEQVIDIQGVSVSVRAELFDRKGQLVRFSWGQKLPFLKIIEALGKIPIPPYLNRAAEKSDETQYQTVYSKREGAVAAPTAGLHFTPAILEQLSAKGVDLQELTLHVSAGTFKPVKTENALEHEMHDENICIKKAQIEAVLSGKKIIAVGTTSTRTLESLFWYGVKLLENPNADFVIEQYFPYQNHKIESSPIAAVLAKMERENLTEIFGSTRIFIVPGYQFRVVQGLITNFHQPASTLMLLVAAFTGGENWKKIYQFALQNDYRFLSYGDSSFLE